MSKELLLALKEAADSAGISLPHMQLILSGFLREAAKEATPYVGVPVLRGLADEIEELL